MLISTTPTIEGRPIQAYKGVVTGETIIGANLFKDFMAGIRDIIGGRRKFCVKPKTPRWPKCNNEPNKWAPTPLLV